MIVSFKKSIVIILLYYVGFLFNSFNILYLFPLVLLPEQFGIYKMVFDTALLLSKLDIGQSILKFYPEFKNKPYEKGAFISFIIISAISIYAIITILFILLNNQLTSFFIKKSYDIVQYFPIIIFTAFFIVMNITVKFWYIALNKNFIPNFLQNVLMKVLVSISALLYLFRVINFKVMLCSISFIYALTLCILLLYLSYIGELNINFHLKSLNKKFIKNFFIYNAYTVLGESMLMMTVKIDSLMIASILGLKYVAVYSIASHIGSFIEIPRRAIKQFSYPLLSNSLSSNDIKTVEKTYKDLSLYQYTLGILLFVIVIGNIRDMFLIIPKNNIYIDQGIYVALIIALSRLINMSFSISSDIIVMSSEFKYSFAMIVTLLIISIISNYFLIPIFGINGAAISTFISVLIYDLIGYLLVWYKFKLQFLSSRFLLVTLIGIITFIINLFVTNLGSGILFLVIKISIICLTYGILTILFNIFPNLNAKILKLIS